MKTISAFLFLYFALTVQADLKVSIYYETLCPDCKLFIPQQLYPTYKILKAYFQTDLIPYGWASRTKENGTWVFQCQHGPNECYGNKIHACLLNTNLIFDKQMEFIACLEEEENSDFDQTGPKCGNEAGISWESIKQCATSEIGSEYLAAMGDRMDQVQPRPNGVPYIRFNDTSDDSRSNEAQYNLKKVICELIGQPKECQNEEPQVQLIY